MIRHRSAVVCLLPSPLLAGLPGLVLAALSSLVLACGEGSGEPGEAPAATPAPTAAPKATSSAPSDLPLGLLVAISKFERKDGKPVPMSELMLLVREDGAWKGTPVDDPESNVFHKAMVYTPPGEAPGILTLGGTAAVLKLWRKGAGGLVPGETLWKEDFGGKHSRMRDAEIADLYGDGRAELAGASEDQSVIAGVPREGAKLQREERMERPRELRVIER